MMPVWTMCRPHSSIATAPAMLARTMLLTYLSYESLALANRFAAAGLAGPGKRERFQIGVGFHRLDNALFGAVTGILDAAEGRHLGSIARHLPDIDRTDLEPFDEPRRVIE